VLKDGQGPSIVAAVLSAALVATLVSRRDPTAAHSGDSARPTAGAKAPARAAPAAAVPASGNASDLGQVESWIGWDFAPQAGSPEAHVADVTVVTALLPDPATSGFPAEFDHGLEALERAAESVGYVLDRHHLPWAREGEESAPPLPTPPPAPAAPSSSTAPAGPPRAGWLLFRRDEGEGRVRLLLVFLVGERPGSGVDRGMLADALAVGERVRASSSRRDLLLLGPYFSGTADSLREGLEAWCRSSHEACAARAVEMVSGTATRRDNAVILRAPSPGRDVDPLLPLRVRFHATVNPDEALADSMSRFLETLEVDLSRRAELTETSTDRGNAYAAFTRSSRKTLEDADVQQHAPPAGAGPVARPARETREAREAREARVASVRRPLQISFPLHIGSLSSDAGATGSGDGRSVDTVPLVSSAAADQTNLALTMALWSLRRQGVSDVGVLATSARDKVFLVTALREAAPDLRAYVYEASVVLTDPAQHRAMDGTLVASSYPLSPTTQIWKGTAGGAQPFPSDAAEGIYNALVGLLDPPQARPSVLSDELKDYVFPFAAGGTAGPSVWISVIIGGQLWPVAVYRPPARDPYVFGSDLPAPPGAIAPPQVEKSAVVLVGLVTLLLLVLGNLLALFPRFWWLRRLPVLLAYAPELDRRRHGPAWLGGLVGSPQAHAVVLVGTWVLSLTGAAAAALYELPRLEFPGAPVRADEVLAGLLLVASLALLAVVLRRELRRERLHESGFLYLSLHYLLPMVLLAWGAVGLYRFARPADESDGRAMFFYARMVHPALGLTPTIPIAFVVAALYVGCVFRLRVLRRSVRLTAVGWAWHSDASPGCCQSMTGFARSARRSLIHALLFGVVVGLAMYFWKPVRPRSIEGTAFDFLVALAFGITFTMAAASIWRAASLWGRLSRLLRSLSLHPIAWSFDHLPGHLSRAFRTPLPRRLRHEDVEAACAATLRLAGDDPDTRGAGASETIRLMLRAMAPRWIKADTLPNVLESAEPERTPVDKVREHYLALRMADALACMCDVTRTMLFIGASSVVAAVLGTAAYPFQPAGTLAWASTLAVAVVIVVAVRIIVGIERDEVLSRLAGTKPGEITPSWSLAARLVGYVVVPLGSLLAAHLPGHSALPDLLASVSKSLGP
jgi:hypothetical protein